MPVWCSAARAARVRGKQKARGKQTESDRDTRRCMRQITREKTGIEKKGLKKKLGLISFWWSRKRAYIQTVLGGSVGGGQEMGQGRGEKDTDGGFSVPVRLPIRSAMTSWAINPYKSEFLFNSKSYIYTTITKFWLLRLQWQSAYYTHT